MWNHRRSRGAVKLGSDDKFWLIGQKLGHTLFCWVGDWPTSQTTERRVSHKSAIQCMMPGFLVVKLCGYYCAHGKFLPSCPCDVIDR